MKNLVRQIGEAIIPNWRESDGYIKSNARSINLKHGLYTVQVTLYSIGTKELHSSNFSLHIISEKQNKEWIIDETRYRYKDGVKHYDKWSPVVNPTTSIESLLKEIWMAIV